MSNLKKLAKLIENNNSLIQALDSGKEVSVKKTIRACVISNNRIAEIMIDILNTKPSKSNKASNDTLGGFQAFHDLFGGKI